MRVLVTPRSLTGRGDANTPELEPLRARGWQIVFGPSGRLPTSDELGELVADADGWLCGVERVTAETLARATSLRVIARNGVGADAIDHEAAAARGIRIALAPGANANGVAELAVGHMLSALRGIPASHAALRSGGWSRQLGRELADCTVGIVGLGAIGRRVAQLVSGFGAVVVASDPYADSAASPVELVVLTELFSRSDVISLHAPGSADGPLVDGALLQAVRPGAVLVNTARSSLIDAAAVLAVLESGQLSAYCVDAFDQEPPVLDDLLRHPRTVLTAHLGGFTDASVRRATERAVESIVAALDS